MVLLKDTHTTLDRGGGDLHHVSKVSSPMTIEGMWPRGEVWVRRTLYDSHQEVCPLLPSILRVLWERQSIINITDIRSSEHTSERIVWFGEQREFMG
jgi:hypothetical protein